MLRKKLAKSEKEELHQAIDKDKDIKTRQRQRNDKQNVTKKYS